MCFFGFMRASKLVVLSDSGLDSSCHLAAGNVLVGNQTSPNYLIINIEDRPFQARCTDTPGQNI